MAIAVYLCCRDPRDIDNIQSHARLTECGERLTPDNIQPRAPHIRESEGIRVAIYSPPDALLASNLDTCLGFVHDSPGWSVPGTESPSGSYIIFRCNTGCLEVVTDDVASRSAWYYFDEKLFVAGTSQRAITSILGSFDFNPGVVPWVLATGTPGIEESFDKRLHRIRPSSTVRLDRRSWRVSTSTSETTLRATEAEPGIASRELIERLEATLGTMRFDPAEWILPLSGGSDSRALLYYLPDARSLRTVTWGVSGATEVPNNDAQIANELAAAWGTDHRFIPIDTSDDPVATIIERFVDCSEGLVDHIGGYTDGFSVWKQLHDANITGVIRGDTPWPAAPIYTEEEVYPSVSAILWNDYQNLPPAAEVGIAEQNIPSWMQRRPGETILSWRDRLYLSYRHPVVLAALNALKANYVEIANPLLARPLIEFVRSLPDKLRAEKQLFKAVIESRQAGNTGNEAVAFASSAAVAGTAEILRSPAAIEKLDEFLQSSTATSLFSDTLIDIARSGLTTNQAKKQSMGATVKTAINPQLRKFVRNLRRRGRFSGKPIMNMNVLAFRMFIVGRMYELFASDARSSDNRSKDAVA